MRLAAPLASRQCRPSGFLTRGELSLVPTKNLLMRYRSLQGVWGETEFLRIREIFSETLGQAVIFVGPSESSVHFFGARSATLILFATYAIATESRLMVSSTLSGVMPA